MICCHNSVTLTVVVFIRRTELLKELVEELRFGVKCRTQDFMTSLDRFRDEAEQQKLYGSTMSGPDRSAEFSFGPVRPVPQDWSASKSGSRAVVVVSMGLVRDPETGELSAKE